MLATRFEHVTSIQAWLKGSHYIPLYYMFLNSTSIIEFDYSSHEQHPI